MSVYWAVYVLASLMAFFKAWDSGRSVVIRSVIATFLTLFIGYRFEIGVDWHAYELMYNDIYRMPLVAALSYGDPAYSLLNWLVSLADGQIWHINLVCAGIFSIALMRFCSNLPRPALALTVSVPTLIIATAMGYTRQSVAVACIMLAYTSFRGSLGWKWVGWLCLAALFHKSAIVVFPVFMLAASRNRTLTLTIVGSIGTLLLALIVSQGLYDIISLYFEGDLDSAGALPRILVGVVSGVVFFAIKGRREIYGERYFLLRNLSFFSISMMPLYFIIPSTTVVDRIGILLLPFQGAVYSGLMQSVSEERLIERGLTLLLIVAYGVLLAGWLLLSHFSNYWVPYENVVFQRYL